MKIRLSKMQALLLLAAIFSLCSMSFVVGRHSVSAELSSQPSQPTNELDRLQQETAVNK